MSARQDARHRPLLDLLGARWQMAAPVVGAAWDDAAGVAGFGLGDGTVALARRAWPGGPAATPRDGGGIDLVPATLAPPPVSRAEAHRGACLGLVGDSQGGFLCGGDDGRLVHLGSDGTLAELAAASDAWVDPVAAGAGGARACATRRRVQRLGPGAGTLEVQTSVAALAFDPTGRMLAIGHHGGVTLWADDGSAPRTLAWRGLFRALAWSPDGAYLVGGLQENALHGWRLADAGDIEMAGYPGQPRSLSFSADGRFLATSGAARVVCWRFDPPGRAGPMECGVDSAVPVTEVACHPAQAVIAAGHANGAVLLCQPGSDDVLFVRGAGGGAISALAWSGDGDCLALGTDQGEIAVARFPPAMFRQQQGAA
jgi:hypothetical protein